MTPEEFNRYCAEVMYPDAVITIVDHGTRKEIELSRELSDGEVVYLKNYNPHDNSET